MTKAFNRPPLHKIFDAVRFRTGQTPLTLAAYATYIQVRKEDSYVDLKVQFVALCQSNTHPETSLWTIGRASLDRPEPIGPIPEFRAQQENLTFDEACSFLACVEIHRMRRKGDQRPDKEIIAELRSNPKLPKRHFLNYWDKEVPTKMFHFSDRSKKQRSVVQP